MFLRNALIGAALTLACSVGASAAVIDGKCVDCHEKQVKSMQDPSLLGGIHAKKGIGECNQCHATESLQKSHASVNPGEKKFIAARRYPAEFCADCHKSLQALAKKTADSKTLVDKKGRVVNPHALPAVTEHAKMGECSVCHRLHKPAGEVARNCTGCHHTGEFINCTGCHAEAPRK